MENYQETKDEAIDRVTYANKQDYHKIFSFAQDWIRNQFRQFSCDDLKDAYFGSGGDIPSEPRVFGAIFRDLSKEKLIFPLGYTISKNKINKKK